MPLTIETSNFEQELSKEIDGTESARLLYYSMILGEDNEALLPRQAE